jgi:hypothetical protein
VAFRRHEHDNGQQRQHGVEAPHGTREPPEAARARRRWDHDVSCKHRHDAGAA